jgi:hypothetical protein
MHRPPTGFPAAPIIVLLAFLMALAALPARATNHALLVGVSNYPGLEKAQQLVGPANDVRLVRDLLVQKKGFAADHVQVLADGVPSAGEPSRKNILDGLGRLATEVKPGDFVYLHFSGHGSQQPMKAGKVPPEPDGLDETFLPRDIGRWDDAIATVQNALVNGEMNKAITLLRSKGAFVWAVFDSCHSGNMTRGAASDVRFRKVEPGSLGIPAAAMLAAEKDAPRSRGQVQPKSGAFGAVGKSTAGMGDFVAFYAARTVEQAPEERLPEGDPNRVEHGLFSYVLAETMLRYDGISYRQLGQQVLQRYASLNRSNTPTPLFEGTALDAPVFGMKAQSAVRQWPLAVEKDELSIAAGTLQQFSEGAIFALLPTAASGDKEIIGYLRGDRMTPMSSILSAIAYPLDEKGKAMAATKQTLKPEQLRVGQYVRLVDPNLRLSLQVALPAPAPKTDSALEKQARQMIADLRAKPIADIRIEWVEPGNTADLRLLLSDDKLWLLAPDGALVKTGPDKSHSIDLKAPKEKLAEKMADSFRTISKASNLLRVANFFGSKDSDGVAKGLEVTATVIRRDGSAPAPLDTASLPQFRDGDQVKFVFHNKGRAAVDLTALYLDSQYGISAEYPARGRLNRLEPNEKDSLTLRLNADTVGTERLMVLAVEAQPQSATSDFSFLAQPKLPSTRGHLTSVDALFKESGFGVTTRGASSARNPMGDADVKVYGWKIVGK